MLEKFSLHGKVAVVTGGGGGLGTAISLSLAKAGADIVVTDFRHQDGEKTSARVLETGRKSVFFPADITKSSEVNSMMSRAIAQWGHVDILINCAGIVRSKTGDATRRSLWDISDQDWSLGINTNLSGAFFCSRAVAKHMVERKWGRIVNIASGWGLRGLRNSFMYNTAKAGVITLTMTLALTFAKDGIRANCIAPGLFRTWEPQERYESRGQFIQMGRVGQPEEIGALAVFLSSDAADYITGELFPVDGGTLADGYAPTGYAPVIPMK
jgi:NAD(P)-dependent dehydrogenase (short-subunit alcohol dehydrogenase family)